MKKAKTKKVAAKGKQHEPIHDFLPDADEIERQPLPRIARITIHLMGLGLVLFLIIATFSDIDLIVTGRGQIITPLPNIVMQPLENSIVAKINVRSGQVVKKGEELATLDPTFSEADIGQLSHKLISLDNQRKHLEAELAGKKVDGGNNGTNDLQIQNRLSNERQASYVSQVQRLEENIGRTRAAMETNRRDMGSMVSRVQVSKELADMKEKLFADKLVTRAQHLEAQDRYLEAERGAQLARSRAAELQKELMSLEAERQSFKSGWRQKATEDLLNISREYDSASEELIKAYKRSHMIVMTAPTDAVVQDVAKLSPGSIARGTEPFLTLVPLGETLEVEVKIDSADIGYIKKDLPAHIKVDAFPFQLHGMLEGVLYSLSEDAFKKENASQPGSETYYQGRIRLTKDKFAKLPNSSRLLPGMTVSAEIKVGTRSVISYLLWPLIKALNESIREPG